MPIREVRAIPYHEMQNFVQGKPVTVQGEAPDPAANEIWIVSITDEDLPKLHIDSEKVLTLVFADIDPQNPSFVPPADTQFFKPEMAVQVVDFLEKAQASSGNVLLLVNCRHGMCRSGAVIDYAANVYGVGFWDTKRKNPQMVPNYWVRYNLFKEHFRRMFLPK